MSQTILIESINNPGELANIIFTPFGDNISISLGSVTLPYLFEPGLLDPPKEIYGNYVITTLEDNCVHYLDVYPPTPVPTSTPVSTPTITPSLSLSNEVTSTPTETVCPTKTPKSTATVTPSFYATPTTSPVSQITPTVTKTLTPTPYGIVFSGSEDCNVIIEISNGIRGYYIYDINLTSATGRVNFEFNAFQTPDRFTIEYPDGNVIYDSGFRGNPLYNQDLNDSGFPNVSGPGFGSGFFNKNTSNPTTAKVTIFSPLPNSQWRFLMECTVPFLTSTPASTPIATPSPTAYGIVFSGSEDCDILINVTNGVRGYYEYILNLNSNIGVVNFRYSAYTIPDKFIIEYPIGTQVFDSGFRGSPLYNQELNLNGFPNVSGLGSGSGSFSKINAFPDQAKLIVFAPLSNTEWSFIIDCPAPLPSSTPASTPNSTPSPTPYGIVFSGSENCDVVISISNGIRGYYVYILDLTTSIGVVNFSFDAYSIPDRFVIEYPIGTQIYDSGFRGSPLYNQELNLNGFPNVSGLGVGSGSFNKPNSVSNQAKLIVFAPLNNTQWTFLMECPQPAPTPATTPFATPSPTPYGIVFSGSENCNVVISITNGSRGYYVYILDLTTAVGVVNFEFNAFTIPDRFVIEYPIGTQIYDSGFRGSPSYNPDLNINGFSNVSGPGLGFGSFNKPNALPDQAKLIVFAPLPNTVWEFLMNCPAPSVSSTPATTPIATPSPTAYGIVVSGTGVCNVVIEITNGSRGYYVYILDLTTAVGVVNFQFNAFTIPDRFVIEYPIGTQIYDSGFRGSPSYNPDLNINGFSNVTGPGLGSGSFNKPNALPDQAKLIVFAPLTNTVWEFLMNCPVPALSPTPATTPIATPSPTPYGIVVSGTGVCNVVIEITNGSRGYYVYILDLTTAVGVVNFNFNAFTIPDRFVIEYPIGTQIYDSGFRGSPSYNPDLNINGFSNVTGPGLGSGSFNKPNALPDQAKLIVFAPLTNTVWEFLMNCPVPVISATPATTPIATPSPTAYGIVVSGSGVCNVVIEITNGSRGYYVYILDLTTAVGIVNFQFNAFTIPDRFVIEYPIGTQIYDSGFRGSPSYNPNLNVNGFSNVTGPGLGSGSFNKPNALPDQAKLIVFAPLTNTVWEFLMNCPVPNITPTVTPTKSITPTITVTKTVTKTNTPTPTITKTTLAATPFATPSPTPYGIVVSGSEVCNVVIEITAGTRGYYVYILDLTTATGNVNFNFNAFTIPDRFVIEYPIGTQIYDSGFRGSPTYNPDLNIIGFPNVSGIGLGSGSFNKPNALPDQAKLIVFAPLENTAWRFLMECPVPNITPTRTPTKSITPTSTVTKTVTKTITITPTITPSITPTKTETPTPTITKTTTKTQTPTPELTKSPTPTKTETPTPTVTKSETPTPNPITPTKTSTPSITPTKTLTKTPTLTKSETPTPTVTATVTPTPTITKTIPPTPSITKSVTPTMTPSKSFKPGPPVPPAPSPTKTKTPTVTTTVTPTVTPTQLGYFSGTEDCGPGLQVNNGSKGVYTYTIDIGTVIGKLEFQYQAFSVPDRFILEWPPGTIVADSGFRGDPIYNNDLLNYYEPTWCNPNCSPVVGAGSGTLSFDKTANMPDTMTLYVVAPLNGTVWEFGVGCPDPGPPPSSTPQSTPTLTKSPTPTKTNTPTITTTKTVTPTITTTKTVTPTIAVSPTPTKTKTSTPTITPTVTITKTPTITKTVTKTSTSTPGLSQTPTPTKYCSDCCPVLYIANGLVYQYNVITNTSTQVTVPNIGNYTTDIAHTRNKMWLGGPNGIREYNISFTPFSAVFSRDIPFNFEFGAGLSAIDDVTLIASPLRTEVPARIVRIDLSTVPETVTTIITLLGNISFVGDILTTSTGKIILTAVDTSNNLEYLYQYNIGGSLEVITQLTNMGFSPNPSALFEDSGNLYIGNYQNSYFYNIGLSSPYTVTFEANTGKINLAGASSLYECNIVHLTPNISPSPTPTVSKTMRTTPTVTKTIGETPTPGPTQTMTKTPALTPTNTKTPGVSPNPTPTNTRTPNSTPDPTRTPTSTITITPTQTGTNPPDVTPSTTPTITTTPTFTPTSTVTPTSTPGCGGIITIPATPPTSLILLSPTGNTVYGNAGTIFHSPYNFNGTSPGNIYLHLSTTIPVWRSSSASNGPLNRSGIWSSSSFPVDTWLGFSFCLNVPVSKTYWIGLGADNDFRIAIDGTTIVNTIGGPYDGATNFGFTYWHMYPVNLSVGNHVIDLYGLNRGSGTAAAFGCEIYDNTISELTAATLVSQLNILFSSSGQSTATIVQNTSGQYLSSGYSCPVGYTFNQCDITCFKYVECTPTPTVTPTTTITPTNTKTPTPTSTISGPTLSACQPIFINNGAPYGLYIEGPIEITPPVGWDPNTVSQDVAHTWDSSISCGYIHVSYNVPRKFRVWKIISLSPLTYDLTYNSGLGYKDITYPTLPTVISAIGNGLCHKDNTGNHLITTANLSGTQTLILIDTSIITPSYTTISTLPTTPVPGSVVTGDIMYTTNNRIILSRTQLGTPSSYFVSQYIYGNSTTEVNFQYLIPTPVSATLLGLWEEGGLIYGVASNGDKYELSTSSPYTQTYISNLGIPNGVGGASQIPSCVITDFIP